MTNQEKLSRLFDDIDSKAFLFVNAFLHGAGNISMKHNLEIEPLTFEAQEAFIRFADDFSVTDIVDNEFIYYSKLFINPDKEYEKISIDIVNRSE